MSTGFAFVNVVSEGVRLNSTAERFGGDFRDGGRSAIRVCGARNSACTTVARHAENSGPRRRGEVLEKGCDKELCRGGVAAWVGDTLGGTDGGSGV